MDELCSCWAALAEARGTNLLQTVQRLKHQHLLVRSRCGILEWDPPLPVTGQCGWVLSTGSRKGGLDPLTSASRVGSFPSEMFVELTALSVNPSFLTPGDPVVQL